MDGLNLGEAPDPVAAVIAILPHVLAHPPDLSTVPLSRPVEQRLRWIRPSPEEESYLYFNNMEGHGLFSATEELRIKLAHLGPPSWKVCGPSDVVYRAGPSLDPNVDPLPEVFARVAVSESSTSQDAPDAKDALAIIMQLEKVDDGVEWRYFDLQDPSKPGLDRRPWHDTLPTALASIPRAGAPVPEGETGEDISAQPATGDEFWSDWSAPDAQTPMPAHAPIPAAPEPTSPGTASSLKLQSTVHSTSSSVSTSATSPAPRMRRLASSTISSQHPEPRTPPAPASPAPDRVLAGSTMTSQAADRSAPASSATTRPSTELVASSGRSHPDVSAILDAAGLVNLSPSLSAAAARALASHNAAQNSTAGSRVLLDDKRAAAETEWMQKVLDASFPKAPGRMFPSTTSSDSDEDSQDRENAAVRLVADHASATSSTSTSPALGRVNGARGAAVDEEDEDDSLEEALKGVWKMYRARVPRGLASSRSRAGERFVAIAHRVVSRHPV